jgi:tRNA modification GTPase
MEPFTIAAVATPPGTGGIGVVKISGPLAVDIATALFRPGFTSSAAEQGPWSPEPRRFYYGHVYEPLTNRLIDEVMVVVMRAPHSYTGEDVVEIQSHSGPLLMQTLLELVLSHGAELAGPGEFTRRAFLNGRIDLTQAEAVMDLIYSRTAAAADQAVRQLDGELKEIVSKVFQSLTYLSAELEAGIDFPDDTEEDVAGETVFSPLSQRILDEALKPLEECIGDYKSRRFLREGLRIAIAGPPNAGKSSLLNCLTGFSRAIVTDLPGTTRDPVSGEIFLCGSPAIITDTAGVREDPDSIEAIGIERAYEKIDESDLLLLVLDLNRPFPPITDKLLGRVPDRPVFLVLNKKDLPRRLELPQAHRHLPCFLLSAVQRQGLEPLVEAIKEYVSSEEPPKNAMIPNLRQVQAMSRAVSFLSSAREAAIEGYPEEAIIIDIYAALDALSEISGQAVRPEVIEQIFSRFCIGK